MATDLETSVRNAAAQIARYVEDIAEMKVETWSVQVEAASAANFDQAKPAAQTIIKLDGDSKAVIPLRMGQGGALEVDLALLEIHERAVATTIEYRSKILATLIGLLQARIR
jgi:hypothetical protein